MNIPVHGIRLRRRQQIITRTGISILTGAMGTDMEGITADSIKALTNSLSKGASRETLTITITITGSDLYAVVD
jgi:uncharacterized protein YqgV (UPF0045/DUF77 family)